MSRDSEMVVCCDPQEEWLDQMRSCEGEQIDNTEPTPALDLVKVQYLPQTRSYRVLMLDRDSSDSSSELYESVVTVEMRDERPFVTTVRPVYADEWKLLGPIVDWLMSQMKAD